MVITLQNLTYKHLFSGVIDSVHVRGEFQPKPETFFKMDQVRGEFISFLLYKEHVDVDALFAAFCVWHDVLYEVIFGGTPKRSFLLPLLELLRSHYLSCLFATTLEGP